ncbi:START domain-containing protein [Alloalcanivorax sp. C16-1]|uniref:START domain-containing protein n=1 Tax=Alloalcanivorax sp. C16-1 TaxID=3390051 RepID=UPI003970939F
MRKSVLPLPMVLLLPLLVGSAGGVAPVSDGPPPLWSLISDRQQVRVFRQSGTGHGDDRHDFAIRGTTRFALRDEYALVAVLRDYAAYPQWLHFVTEVDELAPGADGSRRLRFATRLPWPLRDREALLESRLVRNATAADQVTVALSNRPGLLPPDPDYVRVPRLHGSLAFRRLGDDRVEVDYRLRLDPGGDLPAWLARLLLRDAAHFTLRRLRAAVRQPRYQGHYYSGLELRGPGRPARAENVTKPQ